MVARALGADRAAALQPAVFISHPAHPIQPQHVGKRHGGALPGQPRGARWRCPMADRPKHLWLTVHEVQFAHFLVLLGDASAAFRCAWPEKASRWTRKSVNAAASRLANTERVRLQVRLTRNPLQLMGR
jgi:hypothetical protein